jgi:hypothetical protein
VLPIIERRRVAMADNEGECFNCGAVVLWAKTEKGKNIPLDPDQVPADSRNAKFQLEEEDDESVAVFVPKGERVGMLYATHFDTCTDPEQVERRKESARQWRAEQARRSRAGE